MQPAALETAGLAAGYHGVPAVRDLDLRVAPGEIVLLGGPNGAGKTTTAKAVCGALAPLAGEVRIGGARQTGPLHRRVRAGLGVMTEERSVFMDLTVAENLRLARGDRDSVLRLFPELEKRLGVKARLLSGGEQQMLALGRMLAPEPSVIIADEMSLGLAPIIVRRLLTALTDAAEAGAAVLLIEQHLDLALEVVSRACFLRAGRMALEVPASDFGKRRVEIRNLYL
jgi:branched-chain amino acid transport system ATP-binding protein